MKRVRLKGIFTANFSKSASTLYNELRADKKVFAGEPSDTDLYMFVSIGGNQILFITGNRDVTVRAGTRYESKQKLLDCRLWRIENGYFDPLMMENYANAVGLSLSRPRLEDWYRDWRAERHG